MPDLPAKLPVTPSTGNLAVDTVEGLRTQGLLSDAGAVSWQLHLRKGDKINFNAIALLAYICEWYRAKTFDPTKPQFKGTALLLTNEHIARRFEYSKTTATRTVTNLIESGFIDVDVEKKGDPTRGLRGGTDRYILLNPLILERYTYRVSTDPRSGELRRQESRRVIGEASYIYRLDQTEEEGNCSTDVNKRTGTATDNPTRPDKQSSYRGRSPEGDGGPLLGEQAAGTARGVRADQGGASGESEHHSHPQRENAPTRWPEEAGAGSPVQDAIVELIGEDALREDPTSKTTREAVNEYAEEHAANTRRLNAMASILLRERTWARTDLDNLLQEVDAGGEVDSAQMEATRDRVWRSEREAIRRAWSSALGVPPGAALRDAVYYVFDRLESKYPHQAGEILVHAACRACGRVQPPPLPDHFTDAEEVEEAERQRDEWVGWLIRRVDSRSFDEVIPRTGPCNPLVVQDALVDVYATKLDRFSFARRLAGLTGLDLRVKETKEEYYKYVSKLYSGVAHYLGARPGWRQERDLALAEALAEIAGKAQPTLLDFHEEVAHLDPGFAPMPGMQSTLRWMAARLSPAKRSSG